MLELVLELVPSVESKDSTWVLGFSFRFELWKAPIHQAYKTLSLMRCAYMHLIKHFK
jgi:hypothetical protein